MYERNCLECNSMFYPKKESQVFCCVRCRTLFNRRKAKAAKEIERKIGMEKIGIHYPNKMIDIVLMAIAANDEGVSYGEYAAGKRRKRR